VSEINEEQVGDEELELASRAEQQFASSFLLERMNLEPSEVKRLQAPPADIFPAAWRAFVEDLENKDELSEGLSAALAAALRKAIETGASLNKLLGLHGQQGRPPTVLKEKEKVAVDVLSLMVKAQTFEDAVARVANTQNKSEEAIRSIYKKYADIAYDVKLIEMRYFQEHFSEEDFRRFDRLLRRRRQKQGK
jgi:hypothetical protein